VNEFIHILSSWEHWAFEAVSDAAFAVAAYPVAKWRVRRHDREVHHVSARPECEASASCEPGDHTYSWPCALAVEPKPKSRVRAVKSRVRVKETR
jgi:hypothetical protein